MTVEPSSLLTISIGTLVALLGVVVSASVTWTKLSVRLDHLAREVRGMRSWHHDAVSGLTAKHHSLRDQVQDLEVRMSVVESNQVRDTDAHPAVPRRVRRDHTPIETPRRRSPEDSGSHEGG